MSELPDSFALSLLASYKQNNTDGIVNNDIVEQAVNSTIAYFDAQDKLNGTSYTALLKDILFKQTVTAQNCAQVAGISTRTYYRYKRQYLTVFKNFLQP